MSPLNIVVLMKQVPDVSKVKFDREKGVIDRSSAEAGPNPFDLNALEAAVTIKEEVGGTVTVLSMGPPQAESTLRDALARGADRAILLSDKAFAGADTWATSLTLATAIKKLDGHDLITCGEKTIDGDTGQVGPEIAELLNIPHVAYVMDIVEKGQDGLKVATDVWGGIYLKELKFPGLITVTKDINEPRLPTLRDKLNARKAEIEVWGVDKLTDVIKPEDVGLRGSPTSLRKTEDIIPESRKCVIIRDEPSKAAEALISKLKQDKVLEGIYWQTTSTKEF